MTTNASPALRLTVIVDGAVRYAGEAPELG